MSQILDSAGNPIERAGRWGALRKFAARWKSWIFGGGLTAILIFVVSNPDSIKKWYDLIFGGTTEPPSLVSEMTKAELASMPTYLRSSHAKDSLEIAGLVFHSDNKILDLRLVNTTDQPVVINQIGIILSYEYNRGGKLPPTDTLDLGISRHDVQQAKANKKPFEFRSGFNVAYVIAPKQAERYHFNMNVSANDLYTPADAPEGSFYKLSVYLNADDEKSAKGYEIKIDNGQIYISME